MTGEALNIQRWSLFVGQYLAQKQRFIEEVIMVTTGCIVTPDALQDAVGGGLPSEDLISTEDLLTFLANQGNCWRKRLIFSMSPNDCATQVETWMDWIGYHCPTLSSATVIGADLEDKLEAFCAAHPRSLAAGVFYVCTATWETELQNAIVSNTSENPVQEEVDNLITAHSN